MRVGTIPAARLRSQGSPELAHVFGGCVLTMDFTALPGGDLIAEGLDDLANGRETVPALLVLTGAPRLRTIGISVPETSIRIPEHRLYELLSASNEDTAYSLYNSLIRRLVSFERAAECVCRPTPRGLMR
jgi:hypothetical protein